MVAAAFLTAMNRLWKRTVARLTPRVCTAGRAGLIVLAVSSIAVLSTVGLVAASVLLGGGLAGWLYLSIRWKLNHAHLSQRVGSQRIRRLEL